MCAFRRLFVFLSLVLLASVTASGMAAPPKLVEITAVDYPPFNFLGPTGQPEGRSIEKLHQIFAPSNTPFQVIFVPPRRALLLAVQGPRRCAIAVQKTKDRLPKYHWVGPMLEGGLGLFSRESLISQAPERSLTHYSGSDPIVTIPARTYRDTVSAEMRTNLIEVPTDAGALTLLMRGRAIYWISGLTAGPEIARKQGIEDLVLIEQLSLNQYYMACSRDIDLAEIAAWQAAVPPLTP